MPNPRHECAGGCGAQVPYAGRICPSCKDRQMAASGRNEGSEPLVDPKAKGRAPRGPAPNAGKMLRDHVRMLQVVQKDIGRELYQINERGVREKNELAITERLADRIVELGKEVVPAAKEMRQWEEAGLAKGKKATSAELVAQAITWLVEKATPEEKRRAMAEIAESIGESPLKAVP